jgi:hypothetical protein
MRARAARLVALAVIASACVEGPLFVHNQSTRTLVEIRLASVAERAWESNLLPVAIVPGGRLAIPAIPCGRYDLQFVDGGARSCVMPNVQLCVTGDWLIDDVTLEHCTW